MPYDDYETHIVGEELDHQPLEVYEESEEIKKAEIELKTKEQELKDLRKSFFNLKHPKQ